MMFTSVHLWLAGAVVAALVAFGSAQTLRLENAQTALAHEQRDRATEVGQLQKEAREQAERFRVIESAWRQNQHDNAIKAEQARALAVADVASAAGAADRLRQRVASLAARCSAPARNPSAVSPSAPASAPGDLFADMFGRMDAAARIIARYADGASISGEQCAADYSALSEPTEGD